MPSVVEYGRPVVTMSIGESEVVQVTVMTELDHQTRGIVDAIHESPIPRFIEESLHEHIAKLAGWDQLVFQTTRHSNGVLRLRQVFIPGSSHEMPLHTYCCSGSAVSPLQQS